MVGELVGSNGDAVSLPIPMPAPGPIDPRPAQTDNKPRLDDMNDLMRGMREEWEKREQGEARRVSDAVEQVFDYHNSFNTANKKLLI